MQSSVIQRSRRPTATIVRTIDALPPWSRILLLGLIVAAGLLVRMPFLGAAGDASDVANFVRWLQSAFTYPPDQLYARDPSLNYPPGYALLLKLTAFAYRSFTHAGHDDATLRMLIKLPAYACDLLAIIVAYLIVGRFASPSSALAAATYFAFNPAIIYISAYWGQVDSIPTVLALVAILLVLLGITALAWPVLTFAALIKPPVALLAPLFSLYAFAASSVAERTRRVLGAGIGIALSLGLTAALARRFFPQPTVFAPLRTLAGQLHYESSLYIWTSLNAFNLWAIFGDFFSSDRVHWGPLTIKHWAQALFIVIAALICIAYARRRSQASFLEAAFLLFLAFFLFMPEMHERYEIYATTFAGVLIFRRPYAIAAAVLTTTTLLSLEYSLTFSRLYNAHVTAVNVDEFAPWLVHLCALANVIVFVRLATGYLAPLIRRPESSADSGPLLRLFREPYARAGVPLTGIRGGPGNSSPRRDGPA